jgi:hypothetical protein
MHSGKPARARLLRSTLDRDYPASPRSRGTSTQQRLRLGMKDQPIPDSSRWPWNTNIWQSHQQCAANFAAMYITNRVLDACTLCSAMIFPGEIACEVVLRGPPGWRVLYFHRHCYVNWERQG